METATEISTDTYAGNMGNALDALLRAGLEDRCSRRRFFEKKILERRGICNRVVSHLSERSFSLRIRRDRSRQQSETWQDVDTRLAMQKMANALEAQVNSVDRMIQDELLATFKDTAELEEKLLEVGLEIRRSNRESELFKIDYE